MVAALSCLKSTQNRRLPSFFFTITTGEAQGLLEGQITPLGSICWTWAISSLQVLATIWLAKREPLCFDGVLEQRSTAQVVVSLANDVAELVEEGF